MSRGQGMLGPASPRLCASVPTTVTQCKNTTEAWRPRKATSPACGLELVKRGAHEGHFCLGLFFSWVSCPRPQPSPQAEEGHLPRAPCRTSTRLTLGSEASTPRREGATHLAWHRTLPARQEVKVA